MCDDERHIQTLDDNMVVIVSKTSISSYYVALVPQEVSSAPDLICAGRPKEEIRNAGRVPDTAKTLSKSGYMNEVREICSITFERTSFYSASPLSSFLCKSCQTFHINTSPHLELTPPNPASPK